jgi:hypothetical protein
MMNSELNDYCKNCNNKILSGNNISFKTAIIGALVFLALIKWFDLIFIFHDNIFKEDIEPYDNRISTALLASTMSIVLIYVVINWPNEY